MFLVIIEPQRSAACKLYTAFCSDYTNI